MEGNRERRWVYVVLEQFWSYNDEYYTGADTPLLAFRTLEQAEEYVARCRAAAEPHDLSTMQADLNFEIIETEVEE